MRYFVAARPRLLAFAAGAGRRGAPAVIVFVGRRGAQPGQFLGWAPPRAVLDVILRDREAYAERYERGLATESVDLGAPGAVQTDAVLAARGPFVALVRDGAFVSMLRNADAQRAILRQLVGQRDRGQDGAR